MPIAEKQQAGGEKILHLSGDAAEDEQAGHHRQERLKYAGLETIAGQVRSLLPSVRRTQPQQKQRRHHVAGNDKAKRPGDDAHLRQGKFLADHLQQEIDARIEDEQVLDLAPGPGQVAFNHSA